MAGISFSFEKKPSTIFGFVYRPVASVKFWSNNTNDWVEIIMVADSGADYTILPRYWAGNLGINLEKEAKIYKTSGVGGDVKSYFIKSWKVKLGNKNMSIPIGFLDKDDVPPLLGRQNFMEDIKTIFANHVTTFDF